MKTWERPGWSWPQGWLEPETGTSQGFSVSLTHAVFYVLAQYSKLPWSSY